MVSLFRAARGGLLVQCEAQFPGLCHAVSEGNRDAKRASGPVGTSLGSVNKATATESQSRPKASPERRLRRANRNMRRWTRTRNLAEGWASMCACSRCSKAATTCPRASPAVAASSSCCTLGRIASRSTNRTDYLLRTGQPIYSRRVASRILCVPASDGITCPLVGAVGVRTSSQAVSPCPRPHP